MIIESDACNGKNQDFTDLILKERLNNEMTEWQSI